MIFFLNEIFKTFERCPCLRYLKTVCPHFALVFHSIGLYATPEPPGLCGIWFSVNEPSTHDAGESGGVLSTIGKAEYQHDLF